MEALKQTETQTGTQGYRNKKLGNDGPYVQSQAGISGWGRHWDTSTEDQEMEKWLAGVKHYLRRNPNPRIYKLLDSMNGKYAKNKYIMWMISMEMKNRDSRRSKAIFEI